MPQPTNLKADPLQQEYRWNEAARRYVDERGRFVPATRVRLQLDRVLDGLSSQADTLTNSFRAGNITLAEYQTAMMQNIKTANLAGAAMERGGWYNMTQADFGRVGQIVRKEYEFWQKRVDEIVSGQQRLDGTLNIRAKMYMQQGRMTYYVFVAGAMEARGFDEVLNVLNARESCTGANSCVEQTGFGWLKTDDPRRSEPGRRRCGANCRCSLQYRNSLTGVSEER